MAYVLVVQLIFTVAGLSILGVYIGLRIDEDGAMPTILGATGLFLGIAVSIYTVIQFMKSEARYERRSHD
jgi:hypothetical protein